VRKNPFCWPIPTKDERGPDEELRLLFEDVTRFGKEGKRVAKDLLESLILKQEAKKWTSR
jgi:hypothetical protein